MRAGRDLYLDELPTHWLQKYGNFSYTPVLSEPMDEDNWTGETGLITDAVIRQYPSLDKYDVYMSGPPIMVEAGHTLFMQHGLDESRFFSDAFEYAAVAESIKGLKQ